MAILVFVAVLGGSGIAPAQTAPEWEWGEGGNIDPSKDGSKYAYGENIGWIDFSGVKVSDTQLTGWAWGQNIGWISLSPSLYHSGVVNDGQGALSGYAWGQNVGWISFSCVNTDTCDSVAFGVTIDSDGNFSGWAWGENTGWINFQSIDLYGYGVKACKVGFEDLKFFASEWLSIGTDLASDLSDNNEVDFVDYAMFSSYWLDYCPGDWMERDVVEIPAGEYEMGDHFGDGLEEELPIHLVRLDSFFMNRFEITNQEYCDYLNSSYDACDIKVDGGIVYASSDDSNSYAYCGTQIEWDGSRIDYNELTGVFTVRAKGSRDMSDDPMVEVSWYGAAAYCNWLSEQKGKEQCYDLSTWECDFSKKGYRLPTEAEWEYAARGGLSGRRFPWGDTISHSQANYYSYWKGGSPFYPYDVNPTEGHHPTWDDGVRPYTSPVGSFAANGYGLYDMSGNVWEWCNDWYDSDYYYHSPTSNPTGPISGIMRVERGGSWFSSAGGCRVTTRDQVTPGSRGYNTGFRAVLDLD